MKKLAVFAHKQDLDTIVKKLMRLRCVDIASRVEDGDDSDIGLCRVECDLRRIELESSIADISSALVALEPYVQKSKGLFASKKRLDMDEFSRSENAAKAREAVTRTLESVKRREHIRTDIAKLRLDITAARPYLQYDLPLGFEGTQTTDCFLGVLPSAIDLEATGKELYRAGAIANLLGRDKNGIYASYFCYCDDSAAVSSLLSSYGFLRASFSGVDMTAKAYIRSLQKQIKELEQEYVELGKTLVSLAALVEDIEILYDLEATELELARQKQKISATDSVAIIDGWVPLGRDGAVAALLDKFECAYELSDPEDDDIPPVLLKNNGFATNFEWVLGMYSYPQYGKFDPTFIMSIFYFIIFGIMFADVGYGLIMTLGCFLAVSVLKLSKGLERSLKMFGYCGISCMIFGAIFGSYFGDLPLKFMQSMMGIPQDQLPNLALVKGESATLALLFDPLQNPMGFLVFSLAAGAVHLIAGMAVQFYILCKQGHVLDAIFDVGAYWLLFGGIAMLVIVPNVGLWVTLGAVALIVLTHGRSEKNPIMKLVKGLLGLYDLINYASDLLSYSRILALGLAAGIIAQVINILGTMMGPTVVGFIVFALVFIVGHLLNLAINVLGTFVHTSRLQYIEFFGKFYEDGGVAFEPALASEKYTEHQE